jgi:hypothetical protein
VYTQPIFVFLLRICYFSVFYTYHTSLHYHTLRHRIVHQRNHYLSGQGNSIRTKPLLSPDQSISSIHIHTLHLHEMTTPSTAPSLAPIAPSHPLSLDSSVEPQISAASPVSPSSTNPPAAGPMVCLFPNLKHHLSARYLSPRWLLCSRGL